MTDRSVLDPYLTRTHQQIRVSTQNNVNPARTQNQTAIVSSHETCSIRPQQRASRNLHQIRTVQLSVITVTNRRIGNVNRVANSLISTPITRIVNPTHIAGRIRHPLRNHHPDRCDLNPTLNTQNVPHRTVVQNQLSTLYVIPNVRKRPHRPTLDLPRTRIISCHHSTLSRGPFKANPILSEQLITK